MWFVFTTPPQPDRQTDVFQAVLRIRIRIRRIRKFLGLLDPDLLVRGMDPDPNPASVPDPDPFITKQK